jgi:hypothetical protein
MTALSPKSESPRHSLRTSLRHRHHIHGRQKLALIRLLGTLSREKIASREKAAEPVGK